VVEKERWLGHMYGEWTGAVCCACLLQPQTQVSWLITDRAVQQMKVCYADNDDDDDYYYYTVFNVPRVSVS